MKWVMVLVWVVALAACSSSERVNPAIGGESPETTVTKESSTTALAEETTTTTEAPTTTQPVDVPDLSGVWDAELLVRGQPQRGTVLISQVGMAFNLLFSEGFDCRPADACESDGTVKAIEDEGAVVGYHWSAANEGVADDEGGTYEAWFLLQQAFDLETDELIVDVFEGSGESAYRHPEGDTEWGTYLTITRRG